jgi:hypothetical protein
LDPRITPTGPLTCVIPDAPIAREFYDKRLAALPSELPGGRSIDVEALLARGDAPRGADFPVPRPVLGTPPGRWCCISMTAAASAGARLQPPASSGLVLAALGMRWLATMLVIAAPIFGSANRIA